ncbi:4,5-DOPA dioxygenase extradiol [Acinetobacter populi]|uniref:4,5-DOPA dioxygenase extradiol n=1 Tax=Acinetobacter populi TaxID=1582270 RepID=A0A1Z9YZ28_9GAMM|nr:4,5-DOPA dioxygenase extradiol [Acinetobacter populi]OUY07469.1 4,5-DOPA dioxygenase extradiol [Acinetobacter populi]
MNNLNHLQDLSAWAKSLPNSATMPVIFAGHGTPMNAIEDNEFAQKWQSIGKNLQPQPAAILCISAHWLTQGGTAITAMPAPKTIHDFGRFPQALFDVQYPASGNQDLVKETITAIQSTEVQPDLSWGLDHGTWGVLIHMFPDANIPVVQLSVDYSQHAPYHYALAKELSALRQKGVLIIASGNLIHNLRMVAWHETDDLHYGYDWALEADATMQKMLLAHQHDALIDWDKQGQAFKLAIPTPDHYYPMLYALGLQTDQDQLSLFNAHTTMGSLSMTSFILNAA